MRSKPLRKDRGVITTRYMSADTQHCTKIYFKKYEQNAPAIVRFTMYFRRNVMEISKAAHFWKAYNINSKWWSYRHLRKCKHGFSDSLRY